MRRRHHRDQLIAAPPVQFTQTYLECYDSVETSFINAVGIASGNVQIFIPVVVLVLLPFLYLFLVVLRQVPPKPEYSNEEVRLTLTLTLTALNTH